MRRVFALVALGLWVATAGPALRAASDKTPESIEQQFDKEKSAKKRAELARELLRDRLDELHALISSGTMLEQSTPQIQNYVSAAERLGSAVREARRASTSKQSEMFLRSQLRELEDLKITVSAAERPILDDVISHASKLRDEILYSIMIPAEAAAKK